MAVTKVWTRTHGQFLATGTTPTSANANNTLTTAGLGGTNITTLRLRTDIELYVIAGGGTTDVNLSFAYETIMVMGSLAVKGGINTTSFTPLTDEDLPPSTAGLGDWGQWEYLYPEINFVNVSVPQLVVVTWRPRQGTVDTQLRRSVAAPNSIEIWMPWEIQDGSGLINTTDAGGNTYFLGARFAQSLLYEEKT